MTPIFFSSEILEGLRKEKCLFSLRLHPECFKTLSFSLQGSILTAVGGCHPHNWLQKFLQALYISPMANLAVSNLLQISCSHELTWLTSKVNTKTPELADRIPLHKIPQSCWFVPAIAFMLRSKLFSYYAKSIDKSALQAVTCNQGYAISVPYYYWLICFLP